MNRKSRTANQQGFTISQMIVTLAIIAIVSTVGVLGIKNARAEFRLQNNARLFATYIEKARLDAIRREREKRALERKGRPDESPQHHQGVIGVRLLDRRSGDRLRPPATAVAPTPPWPRCWLMSRWMPSRSVQRARRTAPTTSSR